MLAPWNYIKSLCNYLPCVAIYTVFALMFCCSNFDRVYPTQIRLKMFTNKLPSLIVCNQLHEKTRQSFWPSDAHYDAQWRTCWLTLRRTPLDAWFLASTWREFSAISCDQCGFTKYKFSMTNSLHKPTTKLRVAWFIYTLFLYFRTSGYRYRATHRYRHAWSSRRR